MNIIVIAALVLAFAMCILPGVMACYSYFASHAGATAKTNTSRHHRVLAHKAV